MTDGFITKGNWGTFLTLVGEKLLMVQRKHIFVILVPILFVSLSASFLLFFASFFFVYILDSTSLFIVSCLLIISITMSLVTKIFVDWYYHLYILTNRKILEVWYTPLASYSVNDILLDKVNCTEVDLRVAGFFHELVGVGDIVITFDRPTNQEEFILKDMHKSDKIERFITSYLMDHKVSDPVVPIWFRKQET